MEVVENGAPLKTTGRVFGVLANMLGDHVTERSQSNKRGPLLVVIEEEETTLEKYMIDMVEFGHLLSMD